MFIILEQIHSIIDIIGLNDGVDPGSGWSVAGVSNATQRSYLGKKMFCYARKYQLDNSSCVYCVYGCMDSTALNYNPLATCDDGSCTYCVYGCMDTTQFNYNPLATCDDGSCIPIIYGCTDSAAINYYSAANTNNGTCVYCTYGCIDPSAMNYNASATCDDGSCTYPPSCNSPVPTGLSVTDLTHDRAKVNWARCKYITLFGRDVQSSI